MYRGWRSTRNASLVAVAISIALLVLGTARARAHSFEPGVLALRERSPGAFDALWVPPRGAGTIAPDAARLLPRFPEHCRRSDATSPAGAAPAERGATDAFRIDCAEPGLAGARLDLPAIEGSPIDVIVRVVWRDGEQTTGVLRSGAAELLLPERERSGAVAPAVVLASYFWLGVTHIAIGWDHLLFVLALLLLVRSLRALVATITAFTLAHSVTLALAATGALSVPPAPVEALIAASIVLLAAELARGGEEPSLARRFPWVVAFALGLLHGLGFAGALAAVGLPRDALALALVAFNLGVEAGQLAFVAAIALPLVLLERRFEQAPAARLVPAYAIGALASAWTIQRVLICFPTTAYMVY